MVGLHLDTQRAIPGKARCEFSVRQWESFFFAINKNWFLVGLGLCVQVWCCCLSVRFLSQHLAAASLSLILCRWARIPWFILECRSWASPASAMAAWCRESRSVYPPLKGRQQGWDVFMQIDTEHRLPELITIFQTSLLMHVTYSKCLI